MKQKITIEIENDTGVEFEEVAEWRIPKEGEYFFDYDEKPKKAGNDFVNWSFFVLTPKVDHELEEARKKFPVGSCYKTTSRMENIFAMVESVERCSETNDIIIGTNGVFVNAITCTPFPIPVWRCCETDKPKKDGCYHTRHKEDHGAKGVSMLRMGIWPFDFPYTREWLDEGGE